MKAFIIMTLIISVKLMTAESAISDYSPDECHKEIVSNCIKDGPPNFDRCNSRYGAIERMEPLLVSYARDHLDSSYDYLFTASYFSSYKTDRPGFAKLFRLLSDRAFENAIKLVEQITKRGGNADMVTLFDHGPETKTRKLFAYNEIESLGKALDTEKRLSNIAMDIHNRLQRGSRTSIGSKNSIGYDPEITQFLEKHFLEQQAETVRKLSGYITNLWKIIDNTRGDTGLEVYLFDEYLWKQLEKLTLA